VPDARDTLFSALMPNGDPNAAAQAYANRLMPPVQPLDDATPSAYERLTRALHGAHEAISPWNMIAPTDVASFAPVAACVNAWQDSGRARDNIEAWQLRAGGH